MTPQKLKLSILRRAFQGKLVDQIFEEGTGADLLPTIQSECHNKIVNGQIKKFKAFPEITDEDVDFDVPDNWELVRLGTICQLLDGEKRSGDALPYLEARYLRGKTAPTIMTEGKYIAEGTNVILVDGENSGEVFYIPEEGYMGSTFKVLFVPEALLLEYVIYFLQLHKNTLRNNKKGAAIPHLNKDIFFNLILPIPPLAEQKRIVAKIEELLPLIDRYEQAWSALVEFNKRFPVDMQKSILQMAIQGKLVPQIPEEGTGDELFLQIQAEKQALIKAGKIKKEKPLPEITEDEIPFDIPESWKWVKLGDVADINGGFAFKSTNYTTDGVRVVRISDFNESGFVNDKIVRYPYDESLSPFLLDVSNILLCMTGGTVGKSLFVTELNEKMVVNQRVATIKVQTVLPEYIYQVILAPITQKVIRDSKNSTNDNISMETIKGFLIPLPPLAEQKRIVAKLEEILPLCEQLK